jgi:hypothetical protein
MPCEKEGIVLHKKIIIIKEGITACGVIRNDESAFISECF